MIRGLGPILAEHHMLKGLAPEHLELLTGCAANVVFQPGEYLTREGEEANTFYLLRSGKVAIEIAAPGRGSVPVQTIGENEVLGWSWLIPPHQWRFDGRAVEQTRAIALDGACLRGKCTEDHQFGYEMLLRITQVMTKRLEAARLQLMDLYGSNP